jgi:hypothetical protein
MRESRNVQITRGALWAAAAAFAVLLATVSFLLGRESVRRRPSPAAAAQAAPGLIAVAAPTEVPTPPLPSTVMPSAPLPTAAAAPVVPDLPRPALALAPMPPPLPPLAAAAPARPQTTAAAAARDYFLRMQAIQTVGPTGDTGELANKLLTASVSGGDTSGFDDLIRVTEAGADRVRAITPPACCVEYHQRLLAMLAESSAMVRRLKTAITTNDAAALGTLAASGSSLQARATALEDEAHQIKASLGLAP